jgi:hypothetical protein
MLSSRFQGRLSRPFMLWLDAYWHINLVSRAELATKIGIGESCPVHAPVYNQCLLQVSTVEK